MKKLVMFALLIALAGTSGCSFLMKEYDDRNERKLAQISEENRSLVSKVRNLERKVPELNRQIREISSENDMLKRQVSTIDKKLAGADIEEIESIDMESEEPTPVSEPEEDMFSLSEDDENAPPKPAVQAPKSKMTPAAAKIMEMAQKKGATLEQETPESEPTPTPTPQPEPQPAPAVKAKEAAPKSKLTPDAERIMALAKQKAGTAEQEKPEPEPAAAPAPKPQPEPQPTPAVKTEEAAPKSKLTPEAEEIMAMAKLKMGGAEEAKPEPKPVPKPEPKPAPKPEPKPEPAPEPTAKPVKKPAVAKDKLTPEARRILEMARGEKLSPEETKPKASTAPSASAMKKAAPSAVKIKVLSGTGNIASARNMANALDRMGYKSDSVALAPRSNFEENTVYYAKGFQTTAEEIKKKLGSRTIIKPLSWNSEFDIIVVSAE
jgi:outer membrane murein-binding lipoprotein Lpp